MNEFFNWHDTWIIIEQNLPWIALAFVLGAMVGWRTCVTSADAKS